MRELRLLDRNDDDVPSQRADRSGDWIAGVGLAGDGRERLVWFVGANAAGYEDGVMADPLSNDDVLSPPGPMRLAMADTPPEVPPSGSMPAGKTTPATFLSPMRELRSEQGGAPAARGRDPEVWAPPSPKVAQAIRRIALYLKGGWGTGGDPSMGPSPLLMRNIEMMKRGGPMAEKIADHMLATFREHPMENSALPPPTIEGTRE